MLRPKRNTHQLEFFPGGVPAGIIFDGQIDDACHVAEVRPVDEADLREGIGAEFAFIALVAYFEGFCKNHTAALINICPPLVHSLAKHHRDINLSPVDILDHAQNLATNFGSLVVERLDFGTAKSINTFYGDLLGISPLSGQEAKRFHALLEDRHLIVHHGNIFTPAYAAERFIRREVGRSRCFLDSLEVKPSDVRSAATFLQKLSAKIRVTSCRAVQAYTKKHGIRLASPNLRALDLLDDVAQTG